MDEIHFTKDEIHFLIDEIHFIKDEIHFTKDEINPKMVRELVQKDIITHKISICVALSSLTAGPDSPSLHFI